MVYVGNKLMVGRDAGRMADSWGPKLSDSVLKLCMAHAMGMMMPPYSRGTKSMCLPRLRLVREADNTVRAVKCSLAASSQPSVSSNWLR